MSASNMSRPQEPVNTTSSPAQGRLPAFAVGTIDFVLSEWPADQLLPGIPMHARLAPGSQVSEGTIGKVPGRYLGGRGWVGLTGGWSHGLGAVGLTPDAVATWPTRQVCVTGRASPALDIDVEDEAVAGEIQQLAEKVIGTPFEHVRTRCGTGRRLIPFLPWAGEVARWQVRFTLPATGAAVHAVEIIGAGFQWLAAGDHKSGCPYEWRAGVPPYTDLPGLIEEQSQELRTAVVSWIEGQGGALATKARIGVAGERRQTDDLEPLLSLESLEQLLRAVPDDPETVTGWDEGVSLLASMRYALGSAGRECPACVEAWAAAYPGSPDGWAAARWRSFDNGVEVTEGTLAMWIDRQAPEPLAEQLRAEMRLGAARRAFGGGTPAGFEGRSSDGGALDASGADPADEIPAAMAQADDLDPLERAQQVVREAFVYREATGEWVRTGDGVIMEGKTFAATQEVRALAREVDRRARIDHEAAIEEWRELPAEERRGRPRPTVPPRLSREARVETCLQICRPVQLVTYAPGRPRFFKDHRRDSYAETFNLYQAFSNPFSGEAVTEPQVRPFLDLLDHVLPGHAEQTYFLDVMSYIAQNPGMKIHHAPVLFSRTQGVGKDTLLRVLKYGVVGEFNFAGITAQRIEDEFNADWAARQVVYVSELPSFGKKDLYDRLKDYVASGAGSFSVNNKGVKRFEMANLHCWFFTTNKEDALALDENDRRFVVLHAREQKLPPDLRDRVAEFFDYDHDRGVGSARGYHLAGEWLRQRAISADFSPYECGLRTEAKVEMETQTLPDVAQALLQNLTGDGPWAGRETIDLVEAREWMRQNGARFVAISDIHKTLALAGFIWPDRRDGRNRINVGVAKRQVMIRNGLKEGVTQRTIAEKLVHEVRDYSPSMAERIAQGMRAQGPKIVGVGEVD